MFGSTGSSKNESATPRNVERSAISPERVGHFLPMTNSPMRLGLLTAYSRNTVCFLTGFNSAKRSTRSDRSFDGLGKNTGRQSSQGIWTIRITGRFSAASPGGIGN